MKRVCLTLATAGAAALSTGCASTYGGLTSANNLGAAEYRPAVLVPPERQAAYDGILAACRQAAFNRQVTSANKAQQDSLTGAVTGAAQGVGSGYQIGSMFKSAGLDASSTRSALAGGAFGLIGSLAGSFAEGTSDTSAQTRDALLTCLRSQATRVGYTVLE